MTLKRDDSKNWGVAIAKGMTIILMVFGHTSCFESANNFLLLMRMPLFFLMSGYCFKEKYIIDGSKYLRRRVTGIYLPYVKWSLIFLILHNIFFHLHFYVPEMIVHDSPVNMYGWKEMLLRAGAIIGVMRGHDILLGGYWFLHDLFYGSLLFYVGLKFVKNRYLAAFIWLVIAAILSITGWQIRYIGINSHLFLAAFFITVGHCYRMGKWSWAEKWWYIIATAVTLYSVSRYWHCSMTTYQGVEVFAYSACAIAGALMLFGLGEQIAKHSGMIVRFLCYTGGKTFVILTWHLIVLKVVSFAIILIYKLPIERLAEFPLIREYANKGWWFVYFIVGVGLPLLWTFLYDKLKEYRSHNNHSGPKMRVRQKKVCMCILA